MSRKKQEIQLMVKNQNILVKPLKFTKRKVIKEMKW